MLLIASSLPLIGVCISSRTRCKESAISCLICCCNVIKSAVVAMPTCYCETAGAADLENIQVTPLAVALISKWKSVLGRALSQRGCVGRVIECTQHLCDKENQVCKSVTVSSLCAIQHPPRDTGRKEERRARKEEEKSRTEKKLSCASRVVVSDARMLCM